MSSYVFNKNKTVYVLFIKPIIFNRNESEWKMDDAFFCYIAMVAASGPLKEKIALKLILMKVYPCTKNEVYHKGFLQ